MSFIWFILKRLFPFHLLTILLIGVASFKQWSRRWQLSIVLLGILLSVAHLHPNVLPWSLWPGLFGAWVSHQLFNGKNLSTVLAITAVLYLGTALALILLAIGQWSYGYADIAYQGQADTIVYTHKTSGYLFVEE